MRSISILPPRGVSLASGGAVTEATRMSKFVIVFSHMAELGVFFAAAAILAFGLLGLK